MNTATSELESLKHRLLETWSAGNWGLIARGLRRSAEGFLDDLEVSPGERLLDVACGDGQLAVPAARAGARAVGIDIAPAWIEQARDRTESEGLDIRFDVGDVEDMPYETESFDTVVSLIGAMFAPRPDVAASEMLRVCRPGGRVVMGNWTPEGTVGDFFRIVASHAPPPDMPSPLMWGDEDCVRERFGDSVSELRLNRRLLHFDYPMPPEQVVAHYLEHFGPTRKAFESLDEEGQASLRGELLQLWEANNQDSSGATTRSDAEILEVVAVKA